MTVVLTNFSGDAKIRDFMRPTIDQFLYLVDRSSVDDRLSLMSDKSKFDIFETLNFHDSSILRLEMLQENRLDIDIQLYEIFYPGSPQVSVTVSGIFNFKAVSDLLCKLQEIWKDEQSEDPFFGRIDAFHLDKNKASSNTDKWIWLDVDGDGVCIHARKISCKLIGAPTG